MLLMLAPLIAILAQAQPAATFESRVKAVVADSGAEVAVAFRTLDGSRELLIDADKTFHAASTMKVPVMIELFRQASTGSTIPCPFATNSAASSTEACTR